MPPALSLQNLLPAGITFVQATATAGTYNSTTGKWSVPALNSDQQAVLTITGNITQAGSIVNTAEVTTANEPDTDSSPDNGVATEDDQSSVSIPVTQVSDIEEQYRLLMQQITSLVNNGRLTPREGRILKHFIDLSLRLEKNGHIRPSIAVLKVFIIVVRNATHKTHLTNADRKALILTAQNIIEQLKSTQDSNAARWNDDPDKELARMESDATMELLGFTFKEITLIRSAALQPFHLNWYTQPGTIDCLRSRWQNNATSAGQDPAVRYV